MKTLRLGLALTIGLWWAGVSGARAASVAELNAKAKASEEAGVKAGYVQEPVSPPAKPYVPTAADRAEGVVFSHPGIAGWFTGRAPAQDEVGGKWEMTTAQGEISSSLLGVNALADRKGLIVRAQMERLDKNISIAVLPLVMAPLSHAKRSSSIGVMGDIAGGKTFAKVGLWMAETGSVDIGKGESRAWVVRVTVGSKASDGRYSIPLELSEGEGGKVLGTAVLNLKVLPFGLADAWQRGYSFGVYWGGDQFPRKAEVVEFKQMHDHGIDAGHLFWYAGWTGMGRFTNVGGRLKVNLDDLDVWVQKMKQGGMRGPLVLALGTARTDYFFEAIIKTMNIAREGEFMDKPENQAIFIDGLKQLFDYAAEKKWPEVVIMGPDEPTQSNAKMKRHHRLVKMIHENFPKIKVYGVCMDRLKNAEEVADADILCCNGDFERIVAFGKQNKKTVWAYGSFTTANGYESVRGRYGFGAYAFGPSGVFFWSLGYYLGNPYNEFDGDRADSVWNIAWPPPKKGDPLVETPVFEGIRDGVNDVRYAMTLETMLEKRTDQKAGKVKAEYETLRGTLVRKAASPTEVRGKIVDWILQLGGN